MSDDYYETTGAHLIAVERWRQIEREGYSPEHDGLHLDELVEAALCYIGSADATRYDGNCVSFDGGFRPGEGTPSEWPWEAEAWKPSGDLVRDLVRAGALIAARIDGALRSEPSDAKPTAPDPDDRVWLFRFRDERGDNVNDSASYRGETLADVRDRQAAGYWPDGRPGAWSPTDPDRWVWADDVYPVVRNESEKP